MNKNMINKSTWLALGLIAVLPFCAARAATAVAAVRDADLAVAANASEADEIVFGIAEKSGLETAATNGGALEGKAETAKCCAANDAKAPSEAMDSEWAVKANRAEADQPAGGIAQSGAPAASQAGFEPKPEIATSCDVARPAIIELDADTSASGNGATGAGGKAMRAGVQNSEAEEAAELHDEDATYAKDDKATIMATQADREAADLEALATAAQSLDAEGDSNSLQVLADYHELEAQSAEAA